MNPFSGVRVGDRCLRLVAQDRVPSASNHKQFILQIRSFRNFLLWSSQCVVFVFCFYIYCLFVFCLFVFLYLWCENRSLLVLSSLVLA
jgi:hypothetical protein